jgi:hypothetical protein
LTDAAQSRLYGLSSYVITEVLEWFWIVRLLTRFHICNVVSIIAQYYVDNTLCTAFQFALQKYILLSFQCRKSLQQLVSALQALAS